MDSITIVHIASVEFHTSNDFDIVINSYSVRDSGGLCHLVSDIEVLSHELFTCEQLRVHILIEERIKQLVETVFVFFITHVRYINP